MAVMNIFSQKLTRFSLLRYPSGPTWRLKIPNPLLNSLTHNKLLLLLHPSNIFGNRIRLSILPPRGAASTLTNPHATLTLQVSHWHRQSNVRLQIEIIEYLNPLSFFFAKVIQL